MKPILLAGGFFLLLFTFGVPSAFAAAPFGDTFDTYQNGNVYAQGLWQNYVYAWKVADQGCFTPGGKCLASSGLMDGMNKKSGADMSVGQWTVHFFVNAPLESYQGAGIGFASSVSSEQSTLALRTDPGNTVKVVDGSGGTVVSGLALGAWHTLTYSWNMSDTSNCAFAVSVDGGPSVPSVPSSGTPANCYGDYGSGYVQHVIGTLSFSAQQLSPGQVMFDDVGSGPVVDGCMYNCDGKTPSEVTDTFDTFNSQGWHTAAGVGALPSLWFDDGSDGSCHNGGCLFSPSSAMDYLETGVGKSSGAYTVWTRAKEGWFSPTDMSFILCAGVWSTCRGENNVSFGNIAASDELWHQYYLAWRPGKDRVEVCVLKDDTNQGDCSWGISNAPSGTTLDGVELHTFTSVYGSAWVDDLKDASNLSGTCSQNCFSNVLFLPGIESSRLYRPSVGSDTKLWEPSSDDKTAQLAMYPDGSSVNADIYTRDVIDKVGPFGIYDSFIDNMNTLKSKGTITDWEAVPYDWRLSLEQILNSGAQTGNNISYLHVTDSPYIIQELKRLAASSKTGKVTIVAHSNGGLVTKALTNKLGADASKYIDKIIFVAVPQLGTPEAIAELLHGYTAGIPLLLSDGEARDLAQNMSMTYNLLPSSSYFTYVDTPVITFSSSTLPDWVSKYGDVIHSTFRLGNYIDDTSRPRPNFSDLGTPSVANAALFAQAQSVHNILDAWVPPAGVQLYTIAGWGNETLSGIAYRNELVRACLQWDGQGHCAAYGVKSKLTFDPKHVINGDGTVVEPSAMWAAGASSTRYWVNLPSYNHDHRIEAGLLGRTHKDVLEIPYLDTLVDNIVMNVSNTLPQYISTSAPKYVGGASRLRFALHSPLTLEFFDTSGNHEGFAAATNSFDYNVPGATFEHYGDVQWLSIPKDTPGLLVLHGKASGSFELDIDETDGDNITATTSFVAIPNATTTTATMNVSPVFSPTATSTLVVDEYGDGTQVLNLVPRLNSTATIYQFDGFLQPINDTTHQTGQAFSVFKAGSTIPVKFQLKNLGGAVVQAQTLPAWLAPQKGAAMSVSVDESAYADSGTSGSTYKWDSASQQYIYNWNTKGVAAGYWYKVYAKLDDGTTQFVTIGLR